MGKQSDSLQELNDLARNISQKTKSAIQKIESFELLENNWDSYGALKPSGIAIDNAKKFIESANMDDDFEVYFTAPGRNGDVLIEYQLSPKISAEIYFNSDGTNELLIFDGSDCLTEN